MVINSVLNTASSIPLYQQLADLLRRAMEQGNYPENEKIPSEPELAKTYGIGRPTVRQATDMLVREGLLERRRGSGTYVMPKAKHIDLLSLSGTGQALQASDVDASIEWLLAPHLVTGEQARGGYQQAYELQRLTSIEGEPVLLETFYLKAELFADFDQRFDMGQPLSEQVKQQYAYTVSSADQDFNVMFPSRKLAALMQVNNKMPLLHVTRRLHFGGLANELEGAIYCDIICRTDRFNFTQKIHSVS